MSHNSIEDTAEVFKCEYCNFTDAREENILNHKIANHSNFKCHMCDYQTNSGELLDKHFDSEHFVPAFKCTECDASFHTERMLKMHARKHIAKPVTCDFCGHKTDSLSNLDEHIENFHRITRVFNSKEHSDTHRHIAASRRNETSGKKYSLQEQLSNGSCKFWLRGSCKYADSCRYAHIRVCHYQEKCKTSNKCKFFHESRNNIPFLLSNSRPQPFCLNQNDFPPLPLNRPHRR